MTSDGSSWLYKNKDHGKISAAGSLGMIYMWNVEDGLGKIDKFLESDEDNIKAGALIAIGLINANVRDEVDPAWSLIQDYLQGKSQVIQYGALLGLSLAYGGTAFAEINSALLPLIEDPNNSMETAAMAALCLGLTHIGSGDPLITEAIVTTIMTRGEASMSNSHSRFLCLGLGLLYLGRGELASVTIEALKILGGDTALFVEMIIETCAYAGSGNVLKVQKMLHTVAEHLTEKNAHQSVAVLGIALMALGDELSTQMTSRMIDHLLQYGELVVRRAIPLALGLLNLCHPEYTVTDTLSKLTHDHDQEVAQAAIFALGLIAAGTNNSRIAGILRNLAGYHAKDANTLFLVRIAQGLVHMGKGTLTLNPFHSGSLILNKVALGGMHSAHSTRTNARTNARTTHAQRTHNARTTHAQRTHNARTTHAQRTHNARTNANSRAGILAVLYAALDMKNLIFSSRHSLLYLLALAMQPRMLLTVDEQGNALPVSVRVGQALDTVGQAGKPKTITGFQTQTTPVLLNHGERAELATDECKRFALTRACMRLLMRADLALSPNGALEGYVVLVKNPNAEIKK